MNKLAKTEFAVAALENGTVIDHIPSEALFKVVDLLGITALTTSVTIGNNLDSKRMGKKGIIKVANVFFDTDTLSRIALVAPQAVINEIRDYEVVKKYPVALPDDIIGIVKCNNPKCITNNEPMHTHFHVVDRENLAIQCHFCERKITQHEIILK
ncbi:MAG: aspartate carbamoyltransferase regulatory subunit [Muribaculaceae bacterium]|nr:aspartate carbamoyltransferase regulatory subunit [Muribaculaceae bacterium]